MKLRALTAEEIGPFSRRSGVNRLTVENWLMTVENNRDKRTALLNLDEDKRLGKYNPATVEAIKDGILLASQPDRDQEGRADARVSLDLLRDGQRERDQNDEF